MHFAFKKNPIIEYRGPFTLEIGFDTFFLHGID